MNKKEARKLKKQQEAEAAAKAAAATAAQSSVPEDTDPDVVPDASATPDPDAIDTKPLANASLPARKIKNAVGGTGASSRFKGVGTMAEHGIPPGLRRNEFQDRLLAWNEESGAHLSDDELAAIMDNEHPQGGVRIAERPELVQVIRKFYNSGIHGKQQGGTPPAVQSLQYERPKPKAQTTDASKTA